MNLGMSPLPHFRAREKDYNTSWRRANSDQLPTTDGLRNAAKETENALRNQVPEGHHLDIYTQSGHIQPDLSQPAKRIIEVSDPKGHDVTEQHPELVDMAESTYDEILSTHQQRKGWC